MSAPEILIAEADPWTADLLAQLVLDTRTDAVIHRLNDGESALARCRRCLPELLIVDGELPGLNGVELLREVRRHPRTPLPPCILISRRIDAASVRTVRPRRPAPTWPAHSMPSNCASASPACYRPPMLRCAPHLRCWSIVSIDFSTVSARKAKVRRCSAMCAMP